MMSTSLFDVATGKTPHLYAGRCPDSVNGPESRDPDCPACQAIAAAEAQQERLLQDMHDAGREIDRVMAESAPKAPQVDFEAIARAESTLAKPKPDADGWIPWVGGECPVNPNALVRVRFADFLEEGGCRACQYQWHRSNPHAPSDIVAYRVAGESK